MRDVALRTVKSDIAVIDGIKDLMTDISDVVQTTLLIVKLVALAKETSVTWVELDEKQLPFKFKLIN